MKNKALIFYCILFSHNILFSTVYKITPPNYTKGFFSIFNTVLGSLDFFEKSDECSGLILDFDCSFFCYGHNWWDQYFEPIRLGVCNGPEKKFPTYKKIAFSLSSQFTMSRERGNELIHKYIKVKPRIQKKIDAFVKKKFKNRYVIGIHYRGTDKQSEAPSVSYEEILQHIKQEVACHKKEKIKIFIATDEEPFLKFMKKHFKHKVIALHAIRSDNGVPVHESSKDGYKKGEDALIDCILLSKCSKLYKMASNLSDTSLKFNPSIPVVHFNKAYYERNNEPGSFYTAFNAVLSLLNTYELNKEKNVSINLPIKTSDWWGKNFLPLSVGTAHKPFEIKLYEMESFGFENVFEMNPLRAQELIKKYIQLQPALIDKVDTLINKKFNTDYIISVYYSNVPYQTSLYENEALLVQLKKIVATVPDNYKIALITNDTKAIKLLVSNFPNKVIVNPFNSISKDYHELLDILLCASSNIVIGLGSLFLKSVQQFNPPISLIDLTTSWFENCD